MPVTSRVTGLSNQQADELIQRFLEAVVVRREAQGRQGLGKSRLIALNMKDAAAFLAALPAPALTIGGTHAAEPNLGRFRPRCALPLALIFGGFPPSGGHQGRLGHFPPYPEITRNYHL
jgi:hypothetical protein